MSEILLAAVGGELATDDAIGLEVLRALERAGGYAGVRLLYAGTDGYALIGQLLDCRQAILIDAALLGAAPGSVRGFTEADYRPRPAATPLSGHQISLDSVLSAARLYGVAAELYLVGIQPQRVAPGYGLSAQLGALLPRIVAEVDELVRRQLALWNSFVEA